MLAYTSLVRPVLILLTNNKWYSSCVRLIIIIIIIIIITCNWIHNEDGPTKDLLLIVGLHAGIRAEKGR